MNNYEMPLSSDINTSPNPNSQTEDNPYFVVPADSGLDQISIPKVKACFFVTLFVSIFFMLVPLIQLIPLGAAQFYAPGIIVVIIIILLCFKSKVVTTKKIILEYLPYLHNKYFDRYFDNAYAKKTVSIYVKQIHFWH